LMAGAPCSSPGLAPLVHLAGVHLFSKVLKRFRFYQSPLTRQNERVHPRR
jgi:hypothetical protein